MSVFISALEVEKVCEASDTGRALWRLMLPLIYHSDLLDQTITVPAGFETDFASVPRIPLGYLLTGDTAHASATIHDYLVSEWFPVRIITWTRAADVFLEAMAVEGVPAWRRLAMYWAVRAAYHNSK